MEKKEVTAEQIAAWKKQHKDIFQISVEGYTCYLRKPTRNELGYASQAATKNPLKFNEVILNSCFLGGDEIIKTDDELFLSASAVISEIVSVKEAEIKKL